MHTLPGDAGDLVVMALTDKKPMEKAQDRDDVL